MTKYTKDYIDMVLTQSRHILGEEGKLLAEGQYREFVMSAPVLLESLNLACERFSLEEDALVRARLFSIVEAIVEEYLMCVLADGDITIH